MSESINPILHCNSAAIMSMRHPRLVVVSGAIMALACMSILSAVLGLLIPTILPRRYIKVVTAILFLIFGAMMFLDGLHMQAGNEMIQQEMREIQKEVEVAKENVSTIPGSVRRLEEAEEGLASVLSQNPHIPPLSAKKNCNGLTLCRLQEQAPSLAVGLKTLTKSIHPVFVQTFLMTFLAEWGDRSQVSTIALVAAHVCYTNLKMIYVFL